MVSTPPPEYPSFKIPVKIEIFNKSTGQYELKKVIEYPEETVKNNNGMIIWSAILGLWDVVLLRTGPNSRNIITMFADGHDLSTYQKCYDKERKLCTPVGWIKYHENIDLVVKVKEP